ncbi:MAG TPA: HEAT repeat domain-containing protein [Verrucomicrobiae bacterium]|nr:HEAT repeat domain-containing protein [Verrucomicrobiae bacterium]
MKSRKAIALFVLSALTLATGLYFYLTRTGPEPVYEGKTLDVWLEQLQPYVYSSTGFFLGYHPPAEIDHAKRAIRKIGPQAIPFIVRKLDQNDSPWRNSYRELWPKLPVLFQKMLVRPKPIEFGSLSAEIAFAEIGTNAIPYLLREVHDSNPAVREVVIGSLVNLIGNTVPTRQEMEVFEQALTDSDISVRRYATQGIFNSGRAALNMVPALIANLHCGLKSRNASTSFERYILQIQTIQILGGMGPQAKEAFPDLAEILKKSTSDIRFVLTNALMKIDPVAAAKVLEENPQNYNP